jgi:4,5-DOPA dioxygenase extradiol
MQRKGFLKMLSALPFAPLAMNLNELKNWADAQPASELSPVLFIGHGSPMNALAENEFTRSLNKTGANILRDCRPNAILMVSAHWLTGGTFLQASPNPKMVYDFGGFPPELSQVQYPAPGHPAMATETAEMLKTAMTTETWGLDHGAWSVLKHLFPLADIPVFQMSIDWGRSMEYHFELAQKLQSLREKGILIIGSGNIVHNLQLSMPKLWSDDQTPYDWAIEFDEWAKKQIESGDFKSLIRYETAGTSAQMAVPTADHYIPLLYSLGAAKPSEAVKQFYESVEYGGISMRCLQLG